MYILSLSLSMSLSLIFNLSLTPPLKHKVVVVVDTFAMSKNGVLQIR